MNRDRPSTPACAENDVHWRFSAISTVERELTVIPCPNRRPPTSSPHRCHTQLLRQIWSSGPVWSPPAEKGRRATRNGSGGFGFGDGDGLGFAEDALGDGVGEGFSRLGEGDGEADGTTGAGDTATGVGFGAGRGGTGLRAGGA
ncbi:hypothetical protein ABZ873_30440, partial [Streptomyces sp. NPDC047014]